MTLARAALAALLSSLVALGGCPSDPPPADRAALRLVEVGPRRAEVVAAVASLTGYQPSVAEGLVRRAPVTLPGLTPEGAVEGARVLEGLGAKVVVLPGPQPSGQ
ncbi:MAG: hypothetical protein M9894_14690 [Planctomycetes bacterium]|nr:hypothetical protein [Planctomycetota bacterium]